jgi:hypothetical protein
MAESSYLGELEHMVLLAVLRRGEEAYGKVVRDELQARAGRSVSRSAAYITLERLYGVTPAGLEALKVTGRAFQDLWAGHEALLEES